MPMATQARWVSRVSAACGYLAVVLLALNAVGTLPLAVEAKGTKRETQQGTTLEGDVQSMEGVWDTKESG